MRAIKAEVCRVADVVPRGLMPRREGWRLTLVLSAFLGSVLLLAFLYGCAAPSQGEQNSPPSGSQDTPELTKEIIDGRINDTRVYEVMPESGTGDPIAWSFDEDEPKEIVVVDQQINGVAATVVLDIKTQSSPRANNLRYLAGQIRTEWRLETGWVLRQWKIVDTENISMKYKDLPKPAAPQNSNPSINR
jgi:hypothetical protein